MSFRRGLKGFSFLKGDLCSDHFSQRSPCCCQRCCAKRQNAGSLESPRDLGRHSDCIQVSLFATRRVAFLFLPFFQISFCQLVLYEKKVLRKVGRSAVCAMFGNLLRFAQNLYHASQRELLAGSLAEEARCLNENSLSNTSAKAGSRSYRSTDSFETREKEAAGSEGGFVVMMTVFLAPFVSVVVFFSVSISFCLCSSSALPFIVVGGVAISFLAKPTETTKLQKSVERKHPQLQGPPEHQSRQTNKHLPHGLLQTNVCRKLFCAQRFPEEELHREAELGKAE